MYSHCLGRNGYQVVAVELYYWTSDPNILKNKRKMQRPDYALGNLTQILQNEAYMD